MLIQCAIYMLIDKSMAHILVSFEYFLIYIYSSVDSSIVITDLIISDFANKSVIDTPYEKRY
jgi:hypothetical protein